MAGQGSQGRQGRPDTEGLTGDEGTGWTVWADFIEKQLAAERDRRTSLDNRAIAVVTSSGALASFLFAVTGISSLKKFEQVRFGPGWLPEALAGGVFGSFLLAATIALIAGRLVSYSIADDAALQKMVAADWYTSVEDATQVTADYNRRTVETLALGNAQKARLLTLSLTFQMIAVLFIGLFVLGVTIHGTA